jgi:hypothetical protein
MCSACFGAVYETSIRSGAEAAVLGKSPEIVKPATANAQLRRFSIARDQRTGTALRAGSWCAKSRTFGRNLLL